MPFPRRLLLAAALAAPAAARAQAAPPTRLRGVIAAVTAEGLTVTPREGGQAAILLAPEAAISARKRLALSEIKPNDYLGITAEPGDDGRLRAVEIVVFPEAMRGVGEGHRPFDLTPSSTMTNATVESAVTAAQGRVLTMAFRGGQVQVEVPPEASIVTPIPAERADLVPGAQVLITGTRAADGTLTASRITVSKNGVMLPM